MFARISTVQVVVSHYDCCVKFSVYLYVLLPDLEFTIFFGTSTVDDPRSYSYKLGRIVTWFSSKTYLCTVVRNSG